MKRVFTKRLLAAFLALIVCIGVAGASMAVESNVLATRTVTVDTSKIVNDNFAGIGINHWTYLYAVEDNMNEAFQTVSDKRSNTIKYKYVRMLFMPDWIIDTTLPEEQQKYEWENGIYHFDNLAVQNFFRKVKMYKEAGSTVLVNFGGRVTSDIGDWWQIEDAAVTEGSTRGAPANLEAFADATRAIFEYAWNQGYDNVEMLSFYNEVNGGNYEAFYDKKEYWVEMLKYVYQELDGNVYNGNSASKHYGKKYSDCIEIFGTDLGGFIDEPQIVEWLSYVSENLVDKVGNPMYTYLNTHMYARSKTYEEALELITQIGKKYPGIWSNELGNVYWPEITSGEPFCSNYKYSEAAMVAGASNAGIGGAATWCATGTAPPPMNTILSGYWKNPSLGLSEVFYEYAERGLMTRYIMADSKVYKSDFDSDDMLGAVYGKEDEQGNILDMTLLVDAEENSEQREVTYNLGSKMANRTFKRMVYYYAPKDEDGAEWDDYMYPYGDLLPVADKVITTDANGNFTDVLPVDKHCQIIYTTDNEQVQLVTDKNEIALKAGQSESFNVTEIYGTTDANGEFILDGTKADLDKVTWSIVGKSRSDTNGGYNLTTEGAGTLTVNGKTATYDSTGTRAGDTVAIKITSNYSPSDYTIIIVKIS